MSDLLPPKAPGKFTAFISYRHGGRDGRWARWLHARLETFRLPADLRERAARLTTRVFRDEDELAATSDLPGAIEEALRESQYLIVVCSPRTPRSRWVRQEIETFARLGKADRTLALLVDGSPDTSFPEPLRAPVDPADGTIRGPRDVLAADVRGSPWAPWTAAPRRRLALLRLLATLTGLDFEDLRRRAQEREARRLRVLLLLALLSAGVVAGLGLYAWSQRQDARRSSVEADRNARDAAAQAARAERERGRAEAESVAARASEAEARTARREAEERLADSQYASGEASEAGGRWSQARARYLEAQAILRRLGRSDVRVRLGLLESHQSSPLPLGRWRARSDRLEGLMRGEVDDRAVVVGADDTGFGVAWDLMTGEVLAGQALTARRAGHVAVLPGHGLVAVVPDPASREVELWRVGDERPVGRWTPPRLEGRVQVVVAAREAPVAALGTSSGEIVAWNLEDGSLLFHWPPAEERASGRAGSNPVQALALSRDGQRAAACLAVGDYGDLLMLDLGERRLAGHFQGTARYSFTFDTQGRTLYAGSHDGSVGAWDVATGRQSWSLRVHRAAVNALTVSADDRWLASGSGDQDVALLELASHEVLHRLGPHQNAVVALEFCGPEHALLAGDASGFVHVWDLPPYEARPSLEATQNSVWALDVTPDGVWAATGGNLGPVALWDLPSRVRVEGYESQGTAVNALALTPDARLLAVSNAPQRTFEVLDLGSGRRSGPWPWEAQGAVPGYVTNMAFLPGAQELAVAVVRGGVRVHSVGSGAELRRVGAEIRESQVTAFDRSGEHVLLASETYARAQDERGLPEVGGRLSLFATASGARVWEGRVPTRVLAVALAGAGAGAPWAAAAQDGLLYLGEARQGHEPRAVPAPDVGVLALALSGDGRLLAVGCRRSLHLIDLGDGDRARSLALDDQAVNRLSFARGGSVLAAAGTRGRLLLWDLDRLDGWEEAAVRSLASGARWDDFPKSAEALASRADWLDRQGRADWALAVESRLAPEAVPHPPLERAPRALRGGEPELALAHLATPPGGEEPSGMRSRLLRRAAASLLVVQGWAAADEGDRLRLAALTSRAAPLLAEDSEERGSWMGLVAALHVLESLVAPSAEARAAWLRHAAAWVQGAGRAGLHLVPWLAERPALASLRGEPLFEAARAGATALRARHAEDADRR